MQQKLAALHNTLEHLKKANPFKKMELAERAVQQAYSLAEQQVSEYESLAARVRRLEGQP